MCNFHRAQGTIWSKSLNTPIYLDDVMYLVYVPYKVQFNNQLTIMVFQKLYILMPTAMNEFNVRVFSLTPLLHINE